MQKLILFFVLSSLIIIQIESAEYMLPMRDGVQLHTFVDFPLVSEYQNLTAVMDRSPYGADALELIADIYLLFGFVGVRQDMRGTKQSQGNFSLWHTSANDSYDTMQWIGSQSWSSGKVFTVGASADGIAQFAAMIGEPQWLAGQFILVATATGRPTMFPGGAYRQALIEGWLSKTVPTQSAALIDEVKSNEAPGQWWYPLNDTNQYYKVKFPSVMWAGWYDIFLNGNLIGFDGYQKRADPAHRGLSHIVVDPLGHCQKSSKYFPDNLIAGRVALGAFLSIDMMLGLPPAENAKAVTFYIMGADDDVLFNPGNYWTTLDDWPTFQPTAYYFQPDQSLSLSPPSDAIANTTYKFDPANPVPTIGGNNLLLECGPLDQSPAENRSDVLVFTTAPLASAVAVTGPLIAHLYVSSDQIDTDFTVKLTDVYGDGSSHLIQDGIIRMRWRNDAVSAQPQLMTPGTVYGVDVSLWNTSYVFPAGHRIRVAISSSNYPRFSANPNNGLALNQTGPQNIALNTLYHSQQYPSHITLPVVDLSQMPESHFLLDKDYYMNRYQQHVVKGQEHLLSAVLDKLLKLDASSLI